VSVTHAAAQHVHKVLDLQRATRPPDSGGGCQAKAYAAHDARIARALVEGPAAGGSMPAAERQRGHRKHRRLLPASRTSMAGAAKLAADRGASAAAGSELLQAIDALGWLQQRCSSAGLRYEAVSSTKLRPVPAAALETELRRHVRFRNVRPRCYLLTLVTPRTSRDHRHEAVTTLQRQSLHWRGRTWLGCGGQCGRW